MQAPLCSTVWSYKESCDRTCQKTGLEPKTKEGWNTADKILLAILTLFGTFHDISIYECIPYTYIPHDLLGLGMLGAIIQKRRKMSNKDALLEQAAMSAAGLQQAHVLGIVILVVLVIAVFALLGLKNITWALLLIMNTALFGYLLKLTVDSGVSTGETIIGPDGTIIQRKDSEDTDESEPSNPNNGTYTLPTFLEEGTKRLKSKHILLYNLVPKLQHNNISVMFTCLLVVRKSLSVVITVYTVLYNAVRNV